MGGHVFLSHAGEDGDAARDLAIALGHAGVDVWVDELRLKPGTRWMEAIEEAVADSSTFAVYVGRTGIQRWTDREVRLALERNTTDSSFRIVPVLGPDADDRALPGFLRQHQWVELRTWTGGIAGLEPLIDALRHGPANVIERRSFDTPPFRGLLPFDVEHSHLFFGRDSEVEQLLEQLARGPLLTVIGASGSGKSSLVRAGLVPALHRGRVRDDGGRFQRWRVAVLRPADDPFRELANELPDLAGDLKPAERIDVRARLAAHLHNDADIYSAIAALVPQGFHTLVVVDQFEELFTLVSERSVRERFIDGIVGAAAHHKSDRPVHVVVTLRADFVQRCWDYPDLPARILQNTFPVGNLRSEQLRAIIEKPLILAGGGMEVGLADVMLDEVGDAPGNLTLLEHALLELWDRRRGRTLTHDAYREIRRLRGAIAHRAEDVYGRLNPERQALARQMFLRLVNVGDGSAHTRRRVRKSELTGAGAGDEPHEEVLEHLIRARLLTASRDPRDVSDEPIGARAGEVVVEVAHEALIQNWPALNGWIEAERETIRFERRLADDAARWNADERDSGYLYRGKQLAHAERWLLKNDGPINQERIDFIKASISQRQIDTDNILQAARVAQSSGQDPDGLDDVTRVKDSEQLEQTRMDRELRIAAEIQATLLPPGTKDADFCVAYAHSLPCRSIGGDFFDYLDSADRNFGFVIGDVAGKGTPAALVSALIQGMLSRLSLGKNPAALMTEINHGLFRRGIESRFATAFCGWLAPDGLLTYCNAGHNAPLLLQPSGIRRLDVGGVVLGLFERAGFENGSIQLQPGDWLLSFTDGVPEAVNPQGDEFGDDRVTRWAQQQEAVDETTLSNLFGTLARFIGDASPIDDITALIVSYRGSRSFEADQNV